jgi:hypothetical protein
VEHPRSLAQISCVAFFCCQAAFGDVAESARHEQLNREDLRSVQQYFLARNEKLSRFWVGDKRPIDGTYSAIVVTAVNDALAPPWDPYSGVFVVYGKTNQVYMVLDISSEGQRCCSPRLEPPTRETVYVHWYGDYGIYSLSHKYQYDLVARRLGTRHAYNKFSVQRAWKRDDGLVFSGTYGTSAESLSLHRRGQGANTKWSIGNVAESPPDKPASGRIDVSGKGIAVIDRRGKGRFYPVPVPNRTLYKQLRPDIRGIASSGTDSFPGSIENEIGPFAFDGQQLWFANTFYDGEGMSGVGAIGSFDETMLRYEMRYLPEISQWSASTLKIDGDDLWIGLMRRPEGSAYGGGVLRFNKKTGATRTYPIKDYVVSIERSGEAIYFGTSDSVYELDLATDEVAHIRVEPGPTGTPAVVVRPSAKKD